MTRFALAIIACSATALGCSEPASPDLSYCAEAVGGMWRGELEDTTLLMSVECLTNFSVETLVTWREFVDMASSGALQNGGDGTDSLYVYLASGLPTELDCYQGSADLRLGVVAPGRLEGTLGDFSFGMQSPLDTCDFLVVLESRPIALDRISPH